MSEESETGFLVPKDQYLESGVHIGTKIKKEDMKDFIFKRRDDGLYILDIQKTDERLRNAAGILSKYKPNDVFVVASRVYSSNAAKKFSALTGVKLMDGRVVPGTFTNVKSEKFIEPKLLLICDPRGEKQAISEAAKMGIPIIAICDSDNETAFIDYVVPANNKGKKSLALIFWILAREYLVKTGQIQSYDEFKYKPRYFEILEED